jgi:hypothetical protein
MWPFLALMLTNIGAIIIYLTSKNQGLIHKPLAKLWRLITLVCWLLALYIWLQLYVISAAVFIWLFTMTILLICPPLLSLNKSSIEKKGAIDD